MFRKAFAGDDENLKKLEGAGRHAHDVRESIEKLALVARDAHYARVRAQILKLDSELAGLEKVGLTSALGNRWHELQDARKELKSSVEYVPSWVILLIAVSLGAGTMIGWKRIVVTLGEKIGKSHLTYAQGASAELVAMSTIGVSALAGLPVSTTHVLSSGIAGTMVAGRAGLNSGTVRNILLAWVLTLPVSMALSFSLFVAFMRIMHA